VSFAKLRRALYLMVFAGASLAVFALGRTQFEATPKVLFYIPHGLIGISLAALFVAASYTAGSRFTSSIRQCRAAPPKSHRVR
jgi:hypothetical protein